MSNRVFCIDTSQDIKRTHRCHHQTLEERWIEPATVQSFTRQAAKPLQHGRSLEAVVNDRVLAQCCPHLVPVTSLRHQRSRLRHSATFENKWRICKLETATYDKSCGLLQDRIGRCQNSLCLGKPDKYLSLTFKQFYPRSQGFNYVTVWMDSLWMRLQILYDWSITDSLCVCFAQHEVGESNSCIRTFRRW